MIQTFPNACREPFKIVIFSSPESSKTNTRFIPFFVCTASWSSYGCGFTFRKRKKVRQDAAVLSVLSPFFCSDPSANASCGTLGILLPYCGDAEDGSPMCHKMHPVIHWTMWPHWPHRYRRNLHGARQPGGRICPRQLPQCCWRKMHSEIGYGHYGDHGESTDLKQATLSMYDAMYRSNLILCSVFLLLFWCICKIHLVTHWAFFIIVVMLKKYLRCWRKISNMSQDAFCDTWDNFWNANAETRKGNIQNKHWSPKYCTQKMEIRIVWRCYWSYTE